MEELKLNTIEEAIADFREGKFVIVVDDEDRENEGDLIVAAEKITPEQVNFMLKHARGVLCVPITISRCKELELPHQVDTNTSVLGTPFTVTVDKLEGCSTGVSIYDRAATIRALADPTSTPETFGRPGHVNPLYAQDKGVLRRAGHTEACIDMARLAGLYPAAALMEIMSEDGTMARLPELRKMADEWGLKLISIRDLIAYRLKQESLVEKAVEVLRAENFAVMLTDVVCISCPNVAGSLAKVLDYLAAENIFIEYMYAFAQGDTAHVVIRPSNVERCMEILNKLNCNVLTKNSL